MCSWERRTDKLPANSQTGVKLAGAVQVLLTSCFLCLLSFSLFECFTVKSEYFAHQVVPCMNCAVWVKLPWVLLYISTHLNWIYIHSFISYCCILEKGRGAAGRHWEKEAYESPVQPTFRSKQQHTLKLGSRRWEDMQTPHSLWGDAFSTAPPCHLQQRRHKKQELLGRTSWGRTKTSD